MSSREYLSSTLAAVKEAWPASGPNALKREVALALLADPDLRLRVSMLEEILQARLWAARYQAIGNHSSNGAVTTGMDAQPVQLQAALADPSFAAMFELDPSIKDPQWGMQVLWLNLPQLHKQLGLPPPPPAPHPPTSAPPPCGAPPGTPQRSAPDGSLRALASTSTCSSPSSSATSTAAAVAGRPSSLGLDPALLDAVESHFPHYPTDDAEYLAAAACYCLATRRDPKGLLPHLSLHLTDLAGHLCALATVDGRLAAALQALVRSGGGGGGSSLAARLGELLGSIRSRHVFRQSESLSRKGERVVSLALGQLLSRGGGVNAAFAASAASRPGEALPLAAWRSVSANVVATAATESGAQSQELLPGIEGGSPDGDGLPVFLFEYEAAQADPAGGPMGQRGQAPPQASRRAAVGPKQPPASSVVPPPQQYAPPAPHGPAPPPSASPSTASGFVAPAATAPGAVDPPVAAATVAAAAVLQRRSTEPPAGYGVATAGQYGAHKMVDGLHATTSASGQHGHGPAWGAAAGVPPAEGGLPTGGVDNMRFPLFQRNTDGPYNPALGGGGGAAPSLSASPAGPAAGELHVPREIAEVWSGAAGASSFGGAAAGAGGPARRASVTASSDLNALGGLFAMSPTQESSYLWERAAARINGDLPPGPPSRSAAADTAAGAAMGLRFGGLGLPGSPFLNANGGCGGFGSGLGGFGAGAAGGLVVGSAPPGMPPLFHHQHAHGGLSIGGGGDGGGHGLHNAPLMDYFSWHSSSPDLAGSVAGRSAPADESHAGASWLLARSAQRAAADCAAAAGGDSALAAAVAGSAAGEAAAASGGANGVGGRGASLSVSEESEEAASVVGGLELDPLALTLEAIMGFDPSSQPDPAASARHMAALAAQGAGASGAAKSPPRGLIAAAAAPKAPPVPAVAPGPFGPFAAAASTAGGASAHSSLDSAETVSGVAAGSGSNGSNESGLINGVVNGSGNGNVSSVLTGWSAMAARGAVLPPSHAGVHLAAAAAGGPGAAGGGVRLGGAHGVMPGAVGAAATAHGLAATMAAISAAAAAGSLAAGRAGTLGLAAAAAAAAPGLALGGMGLAAAGSPPGRDVFGGKVLHPKLTPRVREEICHLLRTVPGLKAEDFDDGVMHQLTLKKSEEEAVGALRMLAADNVSGIQHMAAYINHTIKNYHLTGMAGAGHTGAGLGGAAGASLPSATVRANSTPVSSKAILQRLPLRVYRRLEEVIAKCSYMEWKHFDAGVVKVMAQLAEIGEEDVFEELELLQSTDLSNVEYMPAYLNKRLNNRLWSRRKMLSSAAAAGGGGGAGP